MWRRKNEKEAAKWYRNGAELGDVDAQDALGNCYEDGYGVGKNTASGKMVIKKQRNKEVRMHSTNLVSVMKREKA